MKQFGFVVLFIISQQTFFAQQHVQSNNVISFTINGVKIITAPSSISLFEMKEIKGINIGSKMKGDKPVVQFNLNGQSAGAYNLLDCKGNIECGSFGNYLPTANVLKGYYVFTSGKVVLTNVDKVKGLISGTFEGTATDGKGGVVEIQNGRIINCKLNTKTYKY